ncbi:MAG: hypothetical protein ABJ308_01835 [Halieaceae bacterium]
MKRQDSPSVPEFSGPNLHAGLDRLLKAYESKGMEVENSLLPPYGENRLRKSCSWFPGELTLELVSLYGWRGGQEKDAWESEHPFWFRDMSFSSIERAKAEYHSMMESYGTNPEDHELLKYSFPFASFNGGWYVLPTRGHPFTSSLSSPVISVFQGIDLYFYSIETMVNTCIEWVSHPEYEEGQPPREIELEIWEKHNPGIFNFET